MFRSPVKTIIYHNGCCCSHHGLLYTKLIRLSESGLESWLSPCLNLNLCSPRVHIIAYCLHSWQSPNHKTMHMDRDGVWWHVSVRNGCDKGGGSIFSPRFKHRNVLFYEVNTGCLAAVVNKQRSPGPSPHSQSEPQGDSPTVPMASVHFAPEW